MELGLKDKVALVGAAGGGLGSAIAAALVNEGARVALVDISAEALARTAETIGGETMQILWNLAEIDRIDEVVSQVETELGQVSILVNITGGPPPTPAFGQDTALWRNSFEEMVLPVIKLTDRVLPGMKAAGWGRIITSTSSGVVAPIPNLAVSNALRMSLVGWSKTLAKEVGRQGITCNIVVPGRIATRRIIQLDEAKAKREGRDAKDVAAESTASIPIGRYGDPAEYAAAVAFLSSTQAGYITGSTLRVDGGLIASV